mmetsp:Transcript_41962/g.96317  ORF Transcript_41962/g.96317 Transcript_41962/m.96317 type:complete len:223 (+) Transcript_41962:1569-2237(+)
MTMHGAVPVLCKATRATWPARPSSISRHTPCSLCSVGGDHNCPLLWSMKSIVLLSHFNTSATSVSTDCTTSITLSAPMRWPARICNPLRCLSDWIRSKKRLRNCSINGSPPNPCKASAVITSKRSIGRFCSAASSGKQQFVNCSTVRSVPVAHLIGTHNVLKVRTPVRSSSDLLNFESAYASCTHTILGELDATESPAIDLSTGTLAPSSSPELFNTSSFPA